ncbi:MAG TPA: FAD-binding oxidoreductase [Candidatus Paceibacterota bacterium]|nr:FAD-binding oxidoreductase [Candidatus Paceibacterota bacterium]
MKEEIKKFFKGDVAFDPETLKKYSRDASLFEIKPKLVLFPKDAADVKNLVKWANENKKKYPDLSITPRSAGTDMTGGPLGHSIILDFTKYMNRLSYFEGSKITVEPGMYYRDFEKIASKKGMMLPSYPASKSICAIGGMVANNAGGEKTLAYGKTDDFIEELKIVLADGNEYTIKALSKEELDKKMAQNNFEGNLYRSVFDIIDTNKNLLAEAKPKVSKNSSGYYLWNVWNEKIFDLNRLLAGSQGTLGIITEVTFRLVKMRPNSRLTVVFLKDLAPLAPLINELRKLQPESIEIYDDKTLRFAMRYFFDFLKNRSFFSALKFAWGFWPDLFILLRGGLPKLVLLVEFADGFEAVEKKSKAAATIADRLRLLHRLTKSKADTEKYWEIRRESFNLLRKHSGGKRTAPFIDDIIVKPEDMPAFLPALENILKKYPIEYSIAGHAGDGNFHVIPLMDLSDPKSAQIILELAERVYDLVISFGGSISAEHNDGIIRTPYLSKMFGKEMIIIFQKIKDIFDPKNLFNPGKKVGGKKEAIQKYLRKN